MSSVAGGELGWWGLHLAVLALLAAPWVAARAHESPEVRAVIAERASAHGVSYRWLVAVAECESGLDPGAVGARGELGLYQLHPRGLLPLFYEQGYSSPFSAWEASDFAAWAFARGLSGHWSCA